jgi:hypothetical protein
MKVSPDEAEEALAAIQSVAQKTRHSIASGGTSVTLIVTGIVWLIGFTCTQFLPQQVVGTIWVVLSILGGIVATIFGIRRGRRVRSPATAPMAKRVGLFWLILVCYGIAAIAIARPTDGKQASTLVILFIMLGYLAMGMLFSFSSVWWALPITGLALVGYYVLPDIYYLWMAILGGGGMIALGLYIHWRW